MEVNTVSAREHSSCKLLACGGILLRVVMLLALCVPDTLWAQTAEVDIRASFSPSALDPSHRRFKNDTPQGGICVRWGGHCRAGQFSISTPLGVSGRLLGGSPDSPRQNYFMAVDAQWRDVDVVHEGGSVARVRFRISMLAQRYSRNNSGSPSIYGASSGGCRPLGNDVGSTQWHAWGWVLPVGQLTCSRRTNHAVSSAISVTEISIGYELDTPDPLAMLDGKYTGALAYSVGPGGQIDLGDGAHQQNELTVKFELTVAHDFHIRFSSESPSVQLAPEGGWAKWMDHGLPPTRLRQELLFRLTTSRNLSLKLRCEHEAADRCGIRNPRDDRVVPVDVDVTMPGMSNVADGSPAQDTPLLPDDGRAPHFTPDGYPIERRSTLRFTAGREAVAEMLKSPGSHWQGNMTVVFDANP
ncbi:hypothetical protein JY423_11395 [Stenotrophomonas maltophilia]|nr:hypothetical protein [Stenotrophomonas maltophilia]MBN4962849.1 hypothetical protein [Stenotrophomonas maltophilia]